MANLTQAVDVVLHQEDSTLSGVITNAAADRGGLTRFGLCARFHPELVEAGFYDAEKTPTSAALPMARTAYELVYGAALSLAQIDSQGIASALLSFAVNEGNAEAVALLQKALIACGFNITADGKIGPETLAAVNAADPVKLATAWRQFQATYYQHIVDVNPSQAKFLKGWLNRDDADAALVTS